MRFSGFVIPVLCVYRFDQEKKKNNKQMAENEYANPCVQVIYSIDKDLHPVLCKTDNLFCLSSQSNVQ